MAILEICVDTVQSAIEAARGGADRVELCENLAVGGVTPSAGAIATACARSGVPVHVLVRPRAGDFIYSELEIEVMRHDIVTAKALGASGIVVGILNADRTIDQEQTSALVELARPLPVTFHKAFDNTPDPDRAIDTLVDIGINRVLTSGLATTAMGGIAILGRLSFRAREKMSIMAGGKIRLPDIRPLIEQGISEIHVGSGALSGISVSADLVSSFKREMSGKWFKSAV